jgi:hypothetical protein
MVLINTTAFLALVYFLFPINSDIYSGLLSFLGAIIGGALTLFGVKFTLDKEKEDEIPQKLICLNKSINHINSHDKLIKETYHFVLSQSKTNDTVVIEVGRRIRTVLDQYLEIKDKVINEVAHVNGKTYKNISRRFTKTSLLSFMHVAVASSNLEENPSVENKIKLLEVLAQYNKDIENIRFVLAQQSHELEDNFN